MKSNQDNPEYSLIVAPEAQMDIVGILQYTLETWGRSQADEYQSVIAGEFSAIRANPGIGHSRSDIPERYNAHQAGQHVIIFRVEAETVYVVRVLHGSMDFVGRL
jgi:toxin ParE1/3/4